MMQYLVPTLAVSAFAWIAARVGDRLLEYADEKGKRTPGQPRRVVWQYDRRRMPAFQSQAGRIDCCRFC